MSAVNQRYALPKEAGRRKTESLSMCNAAARDDDEGEDTDLIIEVLSGGKR
jgi:hypothetical protein